MAPTLRFDAAAAVPDLTGSVRVAALGEGVTVTRDRWGIPHVEALSLRDAFLAQGFVIAQDRLWQIELDRRRAAGRVAEVLGGPTWSVTDAFHRRVRVGDAARAAYDGYDGATREMVDAHTAGVNAFLETSAARPIELQALGVEPEPWQPWETVAVFLGRHVGFATWQLKLFRARAVAAAGPRALARWHTEAAGGTVLITEPGVQQAVDLLADPGLLAPGVEAVETLAEVGLGQGDDGSNAWLVAGSRTRSGAPLLAGDPHRLFEAPNTYYQLHLRAPGVDAAGYSFAGVPGLLHFGQTERVAWAVTNAMAEYQDLFVCRFDGADRYEVDGEWRPADVRVETVAVRGGEPVEVRSVATEHGPVVVGDGTGVAITLRSSGLEVPGGSLTAAVGQLAARTVDELDAALAGWVEPVNSFLLADTAGTTRYRMAGKVPLRPPVNGWLPVPGWTARYAWRGYVADADLPRCSDPAGGALVSANNRVAPLDHPVQVNVLPAAPHRAQRIWSLLGDRRDLTVDDMAAIHNDAVSAPLLAVARHMAAVAPEHLPSDGARAVAGAVAGWDGEMAAGSAGAAAAAATRHHLLRLVVERHPALARNPFAGWEPPATADRPVLAVGRGLVALLDADDTSDLGEGETWADLLGRAMDRAHDDLVQASGPDPQRWAWSDLHPYAPHHPGLGAIDGLDSLLAPVRLPVEGDRDCVRSCSSYPGIDLDARHGSVARYVFDLGDRRRSRWIVPLGPSGHPASPHFTSQLHDWVQGALVPILTEPDDVAAAADSSQRLHP